MFRFDPQSLSRGICSWHPDDPRSQNCFKAVSQICSLPCILWPFCDVIRFRPAPRMFSAGLTTVSVVLLYECKSQLWHAAPVSKLYFLVPYFFLGVTGKAVRLSPQRTERLENSRKTPQAPKCKITSSKEVCQWAYN